MIINEGNLDASINGNDGSGTISQSSDMNFDTNHFMNDFFGSNYDDDIQNSFGNEEMDAGNIAASLRKNNGKETIIQNKLANRNNNTIVAQNLLNGKEKPMVNGRQIQVGVKIGDIHAAVTNAKADNKVIQRNAANNESNYYYQN